MPYFGEDSYDIFQLVGPGLLINEVKAGKAIKTKAVAAAPPSCKSPPGGVLSFSKAEKKERKKLLLFLTFPPCIFITKNLIKPGRSRIQSPGTAPDSIEPRPRFVSF